MSFFTTFGSFSIAAGVLLIFLIFVMLAAERRGELGIARAVGTRRGHLVQMFLFEGVAYDILAAAVGALLGVAIAYGMVLLMAGAFAATSDLDMTYSVQPRSIIVAYAIGVLLTFVVVTFSAWRVSRMNIVTAIRNLPEPPAKEGGKRRFILGILGLAAGAFLTASGVGQKDAIVLGLGVAIVILSLVPLARAAGVPDRLARTAGGLALVAWFVLPMDEWLLGELKTNFSIFILGGLMIVIGATWAIMYNADILLGALSASLGRFRRIAPILKMAVAYPLRSVFRTGVALAMFTLVVFTLVVGAITTGSFQNGFSSRRVRRRLSCAGNHVARQPTHRYGNGARVLGLPGSDFELVSSQSFLPVRRQVGFRFRDVCRQGPRFRVPSEHDLPACCRAQGFASDEAVWRHAR